MTDRTKANDYIKPILNPLEAANHAIDLLKQDIKLIQQKQENTEKDSDAITFKKSCANEFPSLTDQSSDLKQQCEKWLWKPLGTDLITWTWSDFELTTVIREKVESLYKPYKDDYKILSRCCFYETAKGLYNETLSPDACDSLLHEASGEKHSPGDLDKYVIQSEEDRQMVVKIMKMLHSFDRLQTKLDAMRDKFYKNLLAREYFEIGKRIGEGSLSPDDREKLVALKVDQDEPTTDGENPHITTIREFLTGLKLIQLYR